MPVTAVDLFCGCGGLSAGLIDAGVEVEEAYDCWPKALDAYRRNVGAHAVPLDLSDTDTAVERIAEIDPVLIAGAPPCQDFSSAGKRIEAEQADLTAAFGRIVTRCRPPVFLMENVPQARLSATYRRMRAAVVEAGYSLAEEVLDASRFGVPQRRRRFFVFGSLDDSRAPGRFEWSLDWARSWHRLTVKGHMGDEIDVEHYYRHPRNYSRRSVFSVHEPSPTVRGVNRPVPPNCLDNRLNSAPPPPRWFVR